MSGRSSLELDSCDHAERRVAAVEDLSVFEVGIGQLDPGLSVLPVEELDVHAALEWRGQSIIEVVALGIDLESLSGRLDDPTMHKAAGNHSSAALRSQRHTWVLGSSVGHGPSG